MEIAILFLIAFLAFLFLLVTLIIPFALLIVCALSPHLSGTGKIIWILFMLFTWPFTNYLYGIFGNERKGIKLLSGFGAFGALISLGLLIFMGNQIQNLQPKDVESFFTNFDQSLPKLTSLLSFQKKGINDASLLMEKFEDATKAGLTVNQRDQVQLSLLTMQLELQQQDLEEDRKKVLRKLLELFELYVGDGTFTISEYYQWSKNFDHRHQLEMKSLKSFILGLKKAR